MKNHRIRRTVKLEIPNEYLGSGLLEVTKTGLSFKSSSLKKKFIWSWGSLAENCECNECQERNSQGKGGDLNIFEID